MELPTWKELQEAVDDEEELNPLEEFIHDEEPSGPEYAEGWRQRFGAALDWAVKHKATKCPHLDQIGGCCRTVGHKPCTCHTKGSMSTP